MLEECPPELCGEREEYWIAFYKSNDPRYGFNKTSGNEKKGSFRLSQDAKDKISDKLSGRVTKESTKELLREINLGRKHTDETRSKISEKRYEYLATLSDEERLELLSTTKDCVWVNNGNEAHMVSQSELDNYLNNGYKLGMLPRTKPNSRVGSICINNGIVNRYVTKEELQGELDKGWILGGHKRNNKKK